MSKTRLVSFPGYTHELSTTQSSWGTGLALCWLPYKGKVLGRSKDQETGPGSPPSNPSMAVVWMWEVGTDRRLLSKSEQQGPPGQGCYLQTKGTAARAEPQACLGIPVSFLKGEEENKGTGRRVSGCCSSFAGVGVRGAMQKLSDPQCCEPHKRKHVIQKEPGSGLHLSVHTSV